MSERFKVHAWKACVPTRYRGFESPSFRYCLGAMQVSSSKPRQIRKEAAVWRMSCAVDFLGFFFQFCFFDKSICIVYNVFILESFLISQKF